MNPGPPRVPWGRTPRPPSCYPALGHEGSDLRRWLRGAVIGLGAGILVLAAVHLPLAETYENRTFDVRSRLFADARRADPGIVVVVVDQKSLDAVAAPKASGGLEQGWPWPRDFHAGLLQYLTREAGPAADRAWAPALRAAPLTRRLAAAPAAAFDKATPPISPLLGAAAGIDWIGFDPDDDGVARRLRVNGRPIPLDEDGRMVLRFHGGEGAYRQFGYASVLRSRCARRWGIR